MTRSPRASGGPPTWLTLLLRFSLPPEKQRSLIGDLEEEYRELLRTNGRQVATLWYVTMIARSIPPLLRIALGVWGADLLRRYWIVVIGLAVLAATTLRLQHENIALRELVDQQVRTARGIDTVAGANQKPTNQYPAERGPSLHPPPAYPPEATLRTRPSQAAVDRDPSHMPRTPSSLREIEPVIVASHAQDSTEAPQSSESHDTESIAAHGKPIPNEIVITNESGISPGAQTPINGGIRRRPDVWRPPASHNPERVAMGTHSSHSLDSSPPVAISDLAGEGVYDTSVLLTWSAPGDSGQAGRAAGYDLRWSIEPITPANFNAAIPATGPMNPLPPGVPEHVLLTDLKPGTKYYVALKSQDDLGNWSSLSNLITLITDVEDRTPPAAIRDLSVSP